MSRPFGRPFATLALALSLTALPAPGAAAQDAAAAAAAEAAAAAAAGDETTPETPPCTNPDPRFADLDTGPGPKFDQPFGKAFLGAEHGAVTLVVFIDYACPACRESEPVIEQLVAENPDLTVVFRMVPNDPGGDGAAGTSLLVARSTGDWAAFHRVLDAGGSVDDAAIARAVKAAGLDPACFPKPDAARYDDAVLAEFGRNNALLAARRLKAFPSWVIGNAKATTGIDHDVIAGAIAKARKP